MADEDGHRREREGQAGRLRGRDRMGWLLVVLLVAWVALRLYQALGDG